MSIEEEIERERQLNERLKKTQAMRRNAGGFEDYFAAKARGGHASIEKRKAEGKPVFINSNSADHAAEASRKGVDARYGFPTVIQAGIAKDRDSFKSFAQKIRHITNDGWELIEAVYEVFSRARKAQADGMILESATWLADRGFGKPVQVGQLLDGEGNPVAFTLWNPAENKPIGDVVTLQNGKVVSDESEGNEPTRCLPPAEAMEEPVRYEAPKKDAMTEGPLRPWGAGEAREKE